MKSYLDQCACPSPGYCPRFRRQMLGEEFKICAGDSLYAPVRETHLKFLNTMAFEDANRIQTQRSGPCLYFGDPINDAEGNSVTKECKTCSGSVRMKLFECRHESHIEDPTTTVKECEKCPFYQAISENLESALSSSDMGTATSPPRRLSFCQANHDPIDLRNHFKGRTAFFLGGGTSLAQVNLEPLSKPHIITLAVNNVAQVFKPMIWMCVDTPSTFPEFIFNDPRVFKIMPRGLCASRIGSRIVNDYASVLYYIRNAKFRASTFLTEPTFNWGCDDKLDDEIGYRGARSVMLPALKVLYYFGIKRVILLGCDFHMDPEKPYVHSEQKGKDGVYSNNVKFKVLDTRFRVLKPLFDEAGFTVLNATVNSGLTAFPHTTLEEALAIAEAEV